MFTPLERQIRPESAETKQSFQYTISLDDEPQLTDEERASKLFFLLGAKGFNLWKMRQSARENPEIGLNVPEAFILSTEAWKNFRAHGDKIPPNIWKETIARVREMESKTGSKFGDKKNPLMVSARSGAVFSMPGRMTTITNIGITRSTIGEFSKRIGQKPAWLSYYALIQDFATSIFGVGKEEFAILTREATPEKSLPELKKIVIQAKNIIKKAGHRFPDDPYEQLKLAIGAVFRSWESDGAKAYRRQEGILDGLGTACTIQEMVWGNTQEQNSGSGVVNTRNQQNYSEAEQVVFAPHEQGVKVVGEAANQKTQKLAELPLIIAQSLREVSKFLVQEFGQDLQIEFTVVDGKVYVLQARELLFSNLASFRRIFEAWEKRVLTDNEPHRLLNAQTLISLLEPSFDSLELEGARRDGLFLARGIPISTTSYAAGRLITSLSQIDQYKDDPIIPFFLMKAGDVDALLTRRNIVALLPTNACLLAHIALDVGRLASKMPVIIGVPNEDILPGDWVTVDGVHGVVLRGKRSPAAKDKPSSLNNEESQQARIWLEQMLADPWSLTMSLYPESPEFVSSLERKADQIIEEVKEQGIVSHKAQETLAAQRLFPEEIVMPYIVIKPNEREQIESLLQQIIASGHHATVRTCHQPALKGTAPYVVIRSEKDIKRFFTNRDYSKKYGGYERLSTETRPTEFLVGDIPKGKMDRRLFKEHCSTTLSVDRTGKVIMQFHPYSPLLRALESAESKDIITITFRYDQEKYRYTPPDMVVGTALENDVKAQIWAEVLFYQIRRWWNTSHLPELMRQINYLFPQPQFAIPGLELQARMTENGEIIWAKIYSIKADELNSQLQEAA